MLWGNHYVQQSLCNHTANMSALLSDCIIVEKCAFIQFLWSEGVKSSESDT